MNQESNVETLYLNTLNPKCFVRVNGLSTNPKNSTFARETSGLCFSTKDGG